MLEKTKALKEKCEHLGLTYLPGIGSPTSKFWVIGESPNEDDKKAKQVFVGKSGYFVNGAFVGLNLRRDNMYLTNVSPVQPPENRYSRLHEIGISHTECFEALKEQVEVFKPHCVFTMGAFPLCALTEKENIKYWRGYVHKYKESKVMASFSPSYITSLGEKSAKKEREGKSAIKYTYGTARITFLIDLKKAYEESQFKGIQLKERKLLYNLSEEENLRLIKEMQQSSEVAFDVETKGDWVDQLALANQEYALSFPLDRGELQFEINAELKKLFAKHKKLTAQNGAFDMRKLAQKGLPITSLYADTMIAHHLLYPDLPHGLDYMASIYCTLTEPPHSPDWDFPENRARKNAEHAYLTMEIWKLLEKELKEKEKKV